MDRKELEALAWRHTHRDFRSITGGVRRVTHLNTVTGATQWLRLSSLTDAQLVDRLPRSVRDALSKMPSKGK